MDRIARAAARRLQLEPQLRVGVCVEDAKLGEVVRSLLASVGAVEDDGVELDCALIETSVERPPIGVSARELIGRVTPGRTLVFVVTGAGDVNADALAQDWAPCLDLTSAHAELVDGAHVVSGRRRATLPGAERKRLRGMGHDLDASVLIGRAGVTPDVIAATRAAAERHGLIKVKLTPQCEADKKEALAAVAWGSGSRLIQRIGKTGLLYRPDVTLDPPARRSGRR